MPTTEPGKAVASRNATTHALFTRDIVLPALGEDPHGYTQVQNELIAQLQPASLLERHYVEKIAAASWRLRRLHRWQAQLFEDDTLTEDARLDKLDKVLRHETALHRQIDTAVKMLSKDVPQLYRSRMREQVLEECALSEQECRENPREAVEVDLEVRGRLRRLRKATEAAVGMLCAAPLDSQTAEDNRENCQNEPASRPAPALSFPPVSSPFLPREGSPLAAGLGSESFALAAGLGLTEAGGKCQNKPGLWPPADRRGAQEAAR